MGGRFRGRGGNTEEGDRKQASHERGSTSKRAREMGRKFELVDLGLGHVEATKIREEKKGTKGTGEMAEPRNAESWPWGGGFGQAAVVGKFLRVGWMAGKFG